MYIYFYTDIYIIIYILIYIYLCFLFLVPVCSYHSIGFQGEVDLRIFTAEGTSTWTAAWSFPLSLQSFGWCPIMRFPSDQWYKCSICFKAFLCVPITGMEYGHVWTWTVLKPEATAPVARLWLEPHGHLRPSSWLWTISGIKQHYVTMQKIMLRICFDFHHAKENGETQNIWKS